ncbi:MAG: T9SS type A sorting domain-containing protein [Bacteroidota bacterium]
MFKLQSYSFNRLIGIVFFFLLCLPTFSQSLVRKFDITAGGNGSEYPKKLIRTTNHQFVFVAPSSSDTSQFKSAYNHDTTLATYDYWVVCFDSSGSIIWEHSYGGSGNDIPTAIVQLGNGDFIIGGYSDSPVSGDKTESCRGYVDFWLLRINAVGQIIWDKTWGGDSYDALSDIVVSASGNIYAVGTTLSGVSGDKTAPAYGNFDFIMAVFNLNGQFLFDKTYGSTLNDNCNAITYNGNGGFLLSGLSDSPSGFSKSQNNRGLNDFWMVKIDSTGKKLWDLTQGGTAEDFGYTSCYKDGFYYIGGDSYSAAGIDKTAANKGACDFWVVKVKDDGSKNWDHTFGGSDVDELRQINITTGGRLLLSGSSYSPITNDKSETNLGAEQLWMVLADTAGQKLMDKTFFSPGHDEDGLAVEMNPGTYVGVISSSCSIGGYKTQDSLAMGDVWICGLSPAVSGVEDLNFENQWRVYPTPLVGQEITVESQAPIEWVELLTIDKKKLMHQTVKSNITLNKLSLPKVQPGIYFLRIGNENQTATQKIVVNN